MTSGAADILERIAASVRQRLALTPPPPDLAERAREAAWARRSAGHRSLAAALTAPGVRVIAECKRRSPSAGWLRADFDPVVLASSYERAGAAAISVVTEGEYFAGEVAWLARVRSAVGLPVLQKDFILSSRQLQEAVLAGADAVLLIARLLPAGLLGELVAVAQELGLEVLVEVHEAAELERVTALPVRCVGVNARDLRTFRVDLDEALGVASQVPGHCLAVIESGIDGCAAMVPFLARGYRQFLVGEHLLRAVDPEAALARLVACR